MRTGAALLIGLAFVASACTLELDAEVGEVADGPADFATDPPAAEPAPDDPPVAEPAPADPPAETPPRADLSLDEIVELSLADIEGFWARELPDVYGIELEPVAEIIPYFPSDESTLPPSAGEVGPVDVYVDNAFYCEVEDSISWDAEGLIPELYDTFGDFAVSLVLAHEYAHAVQFRANEDAETIIIELQADCLAGAWAGSLDRGEGTFSLDAGDLEEAVGGYLEFRDPLGTPASDPYAHGSAFDRVSAFVQGFDEGAQACTDYDIDPPAIADIPLDPADRATGGDLALVELVPLLIEDLGIYWTEVGPSFYGVDYPDADVVGVSPASEPVTCDGERGHEEFAESAVVCLADVRIVYDESTLLPNLWTDVGDVAAGYVLIFAHSQAMLLAAGADPALGGFNVAADCLSGAFLADMFLGNTQNLRLSAGDLDEAIVGLLLYQPIRPGFAETAPDPVFERAKALRDGFQGGVAACDAG